MIRIKCPGCGSALKAKDELLGQRRKCPKCGTAVLIAVPEAENTTAAATPSPEAGGEVDSAVKVHPSSGPTLKHEELPERLNRQHFYLICDKAKLVATWENNGQGWMIQTHTGPISATRNNDQLPNQGTFVLVELCVDMTDEGLRLSAIRPFGLAMHWALPALARGDDAIVEKVTESNGLNREQKDTVRNAIKDRFMRDVWAEAESIRDYLSNTDFHSPGVVAEN